MKTSTFRSLAGGAVASLEQCGPTVASAVQWLQPDIASCSGPVGHAASPVGHKISSKRCVTELLEASTYLVR